MNGVFFPMFIQGMAGVSRRLYDGGATYAHAQDVLWLNEVMSFSAWGLGLAQIVFIVNFIITLREPKEAQDNPWEATTLEWAAPSPPLPHVNFREPVAVTRPPYDYSPAGTKAGFLPQNSPAGAGPEPAGAGH
jgi:cytochrome c oxidase subunit 1